jgi:hypothetical protein
MTESQKQTAGTGFPLEAASTLIYIYPAINNPRRLRSRDREGVMSSPTTPPPKKRQGIEVGLLVIILGTVLVVGLVGAGVWSLYGSINLTDFPVNGEWRAQGKPWHLEFRADKTIISSTAPSASAPPQTWISEPGTYKVDYFGNLWVMLKSGKTYTATLVPPPGGLAPVSLNRFDLIETIVESVTVFERAVPIKSIQPNTARPMGNPGS